MAVNRILYFYLLLLSFFFFVLFDFYLFHLLFIFLLLLPVVTLAAALPLSRAVRFRLETQEEIMPKGESVLHLTVENRSLLPCLCMRARLCRRGVLGHVGTRYAVESEESIQFPLPAKRTVTLSPAVRMAYCGRVDFSAAHIDICDMLGLFCLPIPKKNILCGAASVYVLPTLQVRAIETEEAADLGLDSATYSTEKPGSDPSEIFELRDYRAGDSLHSVHWKLSYRMQRLIVREFGLPLNPSLHFLLELPAETKPAAAEYMLGTALAFSEYLMAREITHRISWLTEDGLLRTAIITGADALASAMHELLALPGQQRWRTLTELVLQSAPQPETHLLYLLAGTCPPPDEETGRLLAGLGELGVCRRLTLMPGRADAEATQSLRALGCEVQLLNGRVPEPAGEAEA